MNDPDIIRRLTVDHLNWQEKRITRLEETIKNALYICEDKSVVAILKRGLKHDVPTPD